MLVTCSTHLTNYLKESGVCLNSETPLGSTVQSYVYVAQEWLTRSKSHCKINVLKFSFFFYVDGFLLLHCNFLILLFVVKYFSIRVYGTW
jgi:hypothetical protein